MGTKPDIPWMNSWTYRGFDHVVPSVYERFVETYAALSVLAVIVNYSIHHIVSWLQLQISAMNQQTALPPLLYTDSGSKSVLQSRTNQTQSTISMHRSNPPNCS